MTDHNTLDDLVRVAADHVPRCGHYPCNGIATARVASKLLCDAHAAEWEAETRVAAFDTTSGAAIRRLISAGILK